MAGSEADTIALRVTVTDAERAVQTLRQVGAEGERAAQQTASATARFAGQSRAALGQVGLQLQDVIVQLQAGQRPLTVLIQQGSQIAGAFGPLGAIIGAVGAALAIAASAMFGFEAAAKDVKSTLDVTIQSFDAAEASAKKYGMALSDATEEQRRFMQAAARLDLSRVRAEVPVATAAIGEVLRQRARDESAREVEAFTRERRGPPDFRAVGELGQRARARERAAADVRAELEAAASSGDAARVLTLAEQHQLTGDASTIEGISRLVEIAQRVQVLEAAERADRAALDRLGTTAAERERQAERARGDAARKAMQRADEARREAERARREERDATLFFLLQRAEAGEFDDGRSMAARDRAAKILEEDRRRAQAQRLTLEREMEQQARVLAAPFEAAAQDTQRAFASAFEQILLDGEAAFGELADNLGKAFARSVAQIPALLVTAPITAATQQIGQGLQTALTTGGFAALRGAMASPLGMAAVGAAAGGLLGGGTGGVLGGGLGGAAGFLIGNALLPGIGGWIGGALGGLGGGLLGGMVGGGGGNNRAGARLDLATGLLLPGSDEASGRNQGRANEIIQGLGRVQSLLAAGGGVTSGGELRIRIGDRTGAELFVGGSRRATGDVDEIREAALAAVTANTSGLSATFRRVLETTQGQRQEVVENALEFAATFERLVDPSAAVVQEFRRLSVELEQAAVKAEKYGLAVEEVRAAQQRAAEDAERSIRDQLFGQREAIRSTFSGIVSVIEGTLQEMRTGPLSALAPSDQLAAARSTFERLAAAARSGDLEARQQLAGAGQAFLAEAREFGASGPVFQQAFREVNAVLTSVLEATRSQQDRLLDLLPDAIRDAQLPVIETLERQTRELVSAWNALRAEIGRTARAA